MKKLILQTAATLTLSLGFAQGAFAIIVFDPSNFAQNVITAAKAVKGEIYQDTNLVYQYQMMANQLMQAVNLDPAAMKAQYDEITGDINKVMQLKNTMTDLYGSLQQGGQWLSHVQSLVSRSGKSNVEWFSDMMALYKQNDQTVKNLFQMGNNVMQHTNDLAKRRQDLQTQMALSPTAQATAELTTHYLDIVTSQNSDLLQLTAAKQQQEAQKQAVDNDDAQSKDSAMQSFTAQQDAERAALNGLK
ncbi:TrbJ/VirB5 family protein [Paraburkholderia megapolitana]|uniref:type VI secretion protein n=1 Tax=Paraburkholderia megapolitana TaxID=420953 RepID=UPI0038BBEDE0